jgi:hypothetical protein
MSPTAYLDSIAFPIDRSADPLLLPWPSPGNPGGFISFSTVTEWRRFILRLSLHSAIPEFVSDRYHRAQRAYFWAWVHFDFIKFGELAACASLELALRERYAFKIRRTGRVKFPELLKYLVEKDGLSDDKLPIVQKYSGAVVVNLYEPDEARKVREGTPRKALVPEPPMTLVEVRNRAAHADPFDTAPWGGLLEVVRDLIEYAYRDIIVKNDLVWKLLHEGPVALYIGVVSCELC